MTQRTAALCATGNRRKGRARLKGLRCDRCPGHQASEALARFSDETPAPPTAARLRITKMGCPKPLGPRSPAANLPDHPRGASQSWRIPRPKRRSSKSNIPRTLRLKSAKKAQDRPQTPSTEAKNKKNGAKESDTGDETSQRKILGTNRDRLEKSQKNGQTNR